MPNTKIGSSTFRIGLIADNDKFAKSEEKANAWTSILLHGNLNYDQSTKDISISWDQGMDEGGIVLSSAFGYKGRGMELSDLAVFNGHLYSVDDKTGIVYEICDGRVAPWTILADGDGKQSQGFKGEWMTIKDDILFVGGHGTVNVYDGVKNYNYRWIKTITKDRAVTDINWDSCFEAMQKVSGYTFPGYLTHEGGAWSSVHKSWFFLPRKASKVAFDDQKDQSKATNLLFKCSEDFSEIKMTRIGTLDHPTRGYSSFKFLPGSDDQIVVALKSEEVNDRYQSFITAFTIDGEVLLDDLQVSEKYKFEGLEFV